MKNGKGIKVIIVLVVVIALVVIGGLKIKMSMMDLWMSTRGRRAHREQM